MKQRQEGIDLSKLLTVISVLFPILSACGRSPATGVFREPQQTQNYPATVSLSVEGVFDPRILDAELRISGLELRDSDKQEFVSPLEEPRIVNLLTRLNEGLLPLISFSPGNRSYDLARLRFSSFSVKLREGSEVMADLSGFEDGTLVRMSDTITVGNAFGRLILACDVSRSVKDLTETGFTFEPTFRLIDEERAGALIGAVTRTPGLSVYRVQLILIREGIRIATGGTKPDGSYRILGLSPGTYTVQFVLPDGTPSGSESITIEARSITDGNFQLSQ